MHNVKCHPWDSSWGSLPDCKRLKRVDFPTLGLPMMATGMGSKSWQLLSHSTLLCSIKLKRNGPRGPPSWNDTMANAWHNISSALVACRLWWDYCQCHALQIGRHTAPRAASILPPMVTAHPSALELLSFTGWSVCVWDMSPLVATMLSLPHPGHLAGYSPDGPNLNARVRQWWVLDGACFGFGEHEKYENWCS